MKYCVGVEVTNEHKNEFNHIKTNNHIDSCDYKILGFVNDPEDDKYCKIIRFEVIEHLSNESGMQFYFDSLNDNGILAISV